MQLLILSAAFSQFSNFLETIKTFAPAAANPAVAMSPRPVDPPVTRAVLFSRENKLFEIIIRQNSLDKNVQLINFPVHFLVYY